MLPRFDEVVIRYFKGNHNKYERFGQFFINEYLPTHVWPELYYETDHAIAMETVSRYLLTTEG